MNRLAIFLIGIVSPMLAFADYPSGQVWEASIVNSRQTCGIEFVNQGFSGGVLTNGESGTDNTKTITFKIKSNTKTMSWRITDVRLISNQGRFDFSDDLSSIHSTSKTSVFVDNTEYSWADASQPHTIPTRSTSLRLAPKIYVDADDMPVGETRIQGRISVTCSN